MNPKGPHHQPLRVLVIDNEIVFLGEGSTNFSMTPGAARLTLERLSDALQGLESEGQAPQTLAIPVVLLVEDEPLIREIGVIVLEEAGYNVIQAASSHQALSTLEAGVQIDLLFTDIQIPGALDGLALAHLVAERWPAIQLLLASGHMAPPHDTLPANGRFLPKPYVPAEMLRHVSELISA